MKKLLEQMIKFQELTFAHMEQEAAGSHFGLKEIQTSKVQIVGDIPREWERTINRLQGGGQPAVVPVTDGFCSYCRIQLPTAMVQEIRKMTRIHQCPCCARILYFPEGGGFRMQMDSPRFGLAGIARFSSPKLIVPDLKADSRDAALKEMVEVMVNEGWIDRPEEILRAAIAREKLVSTAVEYGLAFPHVRGVEGVGLIFAIGLKKGGLDFGASKGRLTRIIFFSVIPQAASGFYLKLMSGLVQTFSRSEARDRILGLKRVEEIWDALTELSRETLLA